MLLKFTAVLLKKVNYGEKNIILQTYSLEEGSQSFFLHSSKTKGKSKVVLPMLGIFEIVANKAKGDLLRVTEMQLKHKHYNLMSDFQKASIVMFLNEVLMKSIRDYQADQSLFDFICEGLDELDKKLHFVANFHLDFMLKLSHHLGFYPNGEYSKTSLYFDLYEGIFSDSKPLHGAILDEKMTPLFGKLLKACEESSQYPIMTNLERREMLSCLLNYYRIHIDKFDEVNSREILETVLS